MAGKWFGLELGRDKAASIDSNPALKQNLEEMLAFDLMVGKNDQNGSNYQEHPTEGIVSIDVEPQYNYLKEPVINTRWKNSITSAYTTFANQPISSGTLTKLQTFYDQFSTPEGQSKLADLGLETNNMFGRNEIDLLLGRTKWLLDHGRFPGTATVPFKPENDA
jgi:hypothetical protein